MSSEFPKPESALAMRADVRRDLPATQLTLLRAVAWEELAARRAQKDLETTDPGLFQMLSQASVIAQQQVHEAEAAHAKMRAEKLAEVRTYEQLLAVAIWEIETQGFDTMASVPIYTGGKSPFPKENMAHAEMFMLYLSSRGYRVWNQIPYLDENLQIDSEHMKNIREKFVKFFIPLMQSRKLAHLIMMPGWEKSSGCTTEHTEAQGSGTQVQYGREDWESIY